MSGMDDQGTSMFTEGPPALIMGSVDTAPTRLPMPRIERVVDVERRAALVGGVVVRATEEPHITLGYN